MSCDKWRWTEECDYRPCPGDCDYCTYEEDDPEEKKNEPEIVEM